MPRPRLMSAAAAFPERRPLLVLRAPAGYGKSVLLSQLETDVSGSGPTAILGGWLGSDGGDALVNRLLGAFRAVAKEPAPRLPDDPLEAWRRLVDEMALRDLRGALFIDDVDELFGDGREAYLDYFVRNRPPRLGLALATRGASPIDLHSPFLADDLTLIERGDLAFDVQEIEQRLRVLEGDAPQGRAEDIARATGGWPALVAFEMAESAQSTASPARRLEFVKREVIAPLGPDDSAFLGSVCVLDTLSAAEARALSGLPDAGERLRTLAGRGMIEDDGAAFRFPPQLRRWLAAALADRDGPAMAEAYARGVALLRAEGRFLEALNLATESGDPDAIAGLLDSAGWTVLRRRGPAELADALQRLGEPRLRAELRYGILRAWCDVFAGDVAEVRALLRRTSEADAREPLLRHNLAALRRALAARSDTSEAELFDVHAPGLSSADSAFLRSLTLLHRGGVARARGEYSRSVALLEACVDVAVAAESPFVALSATIGAGQAQHLTGRLTLARERLREGLERFWPATDEEPVLGSLCLVRRAQVAIDMGDLEAGEHDLRRAAALVESARGPRALGLAALEEARLAFARRDWAAAEAALATTRRIGISQGADRLLFFARLEESRIALATGALVRAEQLVREARELVSSEIEGGAPEKLERFFAAAAQTHMARGAFTQARALLARAAATASVSERFPNLLFVETLTALCWLQEGSEARAVQGFEAVFQRAQQEGFRQLFVDLALTSPMARLLQAIERKWARSSVLAVDREELSALIARLGAQPIPSAAPERRESGESLGRKDRLVLFYLSRGLRNAEIADQLGLSAETVKWRLKLIYAKLDAHNRTEALSRARLLALVD